MKWAYTQLMMFAVAGALGSACGASDGSGSVGHGGSGGVPDTGGKGGAGGAVLEMCAERYGSDYPESSGAPTLPVWDRQSGRAVFSLDARTAEGWSVSLVSGDLEVPDVLRDGGLFSSLAVGDEIEIVVQQAFGSFGGHRWYEVVRNASDHALIAAEFVDFASNLPEFADLLGVGLRLDPVCVLGPFAHCYEQEVQTQFRLLIDGDESVALDARTHRPLTIAMRPYTAWLGVAFEDTAGGARRLMECQDIIDFSWPGAVTLSITPASVDSESDTPK